MKKNAVVIHAQDCVATAIMPLAAGEKASMFIGSEAKEVTLRNAIPAGHKFAIRAMALHDEVFKYGESIGRATQAIELGEHVHVHNVESERGRGDWNQ